MKKPICLLKRSLYAAVQLSGADYLLPRRFGEGRLPPEKPEVVTKLPTVQTTPLELRLEGVVITRCSRVAVIRDLTKNRLLRVAEGMTQNGWKLESVDTSSAIVVRRGKRVELGLEIDKGVKGGPPKIKMPFRPSIR